LRRGAWYKVAMSALLFTLSAFGLILVLARLRVPLAVAILAGAATVGLLFGLGAGELARAAAVGAAGPSTIALVVVTMLLLGLSGIMREGGQMKRIVDLARQLLRRPAIAMAALPALIGLLPMPGGALFSAPMVESAAGEGDHSGGWLSAVNYWFRHIWEHWWPLYPGVILTMQLTGLELGELIVVQAPLGVFMAVGGLWLFRGSHPSLHATSPRPARGVSRRLVAATSSIWIILVVWGAATVGARHLPEGALHASLRPTVLKYLPLTLGLLVSLAWTVRLNRLPAARVASVFGSASIYKLGALVLSVMVFQHVLRRVDAAPRIGRELTAMRVPVELVIVALPFIAGMVTGLAVGFVGTSFPIVLGLVGAMPDHPRVGPFIALAYAFGHLGQMMSPLHVCHVVSNRYFHTGFAPVYRRILPPALLTAAMASVYFVLLRWLTA
jgi:hypothetical protein